MSTKIPRDLQTSDSTEALQRDAEALMEKFSKMKFGKKTKPKSPSELISHYTSKGLKEREAAEAVIKDLQRALSIAMHRASLNSTVKEVTTKMENLEQKLIIMDMKLDTKPTIPGVFLAGVGAGAFLKASMEVLPVLAKTVGGLQQKIGELTKGSS